MAIKYGPTMPGFGVNYTSPAVARPGSAIARYVPSYANPTGKTTKQVVAENRTVQQSSRPVNVTGVAIPSYATNPKVISRANQINTGVVSGQPVELVTNLDGSLGSTGAGGPVAGDPSVDGPAVGDPSVDGPAVGDPSVDGPIESPIDAAAALDSAINALLDPEFIGFQGDRAAELRRLQNLRNQLFGDAEFGQTGSVQRQEGLNEQSRRRLAAQRASAGMLQGGSYAGTERGLGTLQRADQDFAMQEMQRPFREQTASDRLREFGLEFDPTSRIFDQMDMDLTGFTTQTQAGREAAARARLAAIQQLAQQGIQI